MYQLSCDISRFASKSLEEGLSVADTLRINHIELTDFGGKPLEQCSGSEVEDIRCALIDTNKTIVLLSTALSPGEPAAFNELFRRAHLLNVQNILIPFNGRSQPPEPAALAEILKMAEAWNIDIVFENERHSFFRDDRTMTDFLRFLPESAGVVYNPAEFVALSHHPFFHMFYASRLKNRIRFLRLNDSLYSTGEPTPLAGGNGEIKELISILLARSFDGWFSVAPYRSVSANAMAQTLSEYRSLLKHL